MNLNQSWWRRLQDLGWIIDGLSMNSWFMFPFFRAALPKKPRAGEKDLSCMVTTDRITCFLLRDRGSSTVLQCQWLRTWDFTKLTSSFQFNRFEHHFHAENAIHIGWVFCSKFSPLLRAKNSFDNCWFWFFLHPASCSLAQEGFGFVGFQAAGVLSYQSLVTTLGCPPEKQSPGPNKWRVSWKVLETSKMAASVTWMHTSRRLKLSSIFFWDGKRNPFLAKDLEIM